MYHMWRMMQVGTSNCVPHMAHDAVKVLITDRDSLVFNKDSFFTVNNIDNYFNFHLACHIEHYFMINTAYIISRRGDIYQYNMYYYFIHFLFLIIFVFLVH